MNNDIKFKNLNDLYNRILPALRSKIKEIKKEGLKYIHEEDIWNILKKYKWTSSRDLDFPGTYQKATWRYGWRHWDRCPLGGMNVIELFVLVSWKEFSNELQVYSQASSGHHINIQGLCQVPDSPERSPT